MLLANLGLGPNGGKFVVLNSNTCSDNPNYLSLRGCSPSIKIAVEPSNVFIINHKNTSQFFIYQILNPKNTNLQTPETSCRVSTRGVAKLPKSNKVSSACITKSNKSKHEEENY